MGGFKIKVQSAPAEIDVGTLGVLAQTRSATFFIECSFEQYIAICDGIQDVVTRVQGDS